MGRFFQLTPSEFKSQFTPLPIEFMYQTIKEKQSEIDNVNRAADIFKNAVKWGRATEKEGAELSQWLKEKTEDVEKTIATGDYQTAVNKLAKYNKELKSDWRWHKALQDFHYREEVDKLLKEADEKGNVPMFIDPKTGSIKQMEGKVFNPNHYKVIPYSDYWKEEFDPQITDKLTASLKTYLNNPDVQVETIATPDGRLVYGYYDPIKQKYEYLNENHPAIQALFGITLKDNKYTVDPNKALIRNLYEEGTLGQSKGFNYLDASYQRSTGEKMPYDYYYKQAWTRVVPKFYTKEDITGGDFNLLPEWANFGYGNDIIDNTRVLTDVTPVSITESNLNTNINDYKTALQNFDQTQRDVAGVFFNTFIDFIDLQRYGIDVINYKGQNGELPSLGEILNYYSNKYNLNLDLNTLHEDKFKALFASLDLEEQENLINIIDNNLTDVLKNLDLTNPREAQTADNIQQLKNSFNSYQSSLNNLSSSGNIIAQTIDNIKESLKEDTEFDRIYRNYENAAKKSKTEVLSKDEFISLLTEIEVLSEKSPGFLEVLTSGDYNKFKNWVLENKSWLKHVSAYLTGIRFGPLASIFGLYKMSKYNENSSDPKDHMGIAKMYIKNKFKDGSFVTDEDVQYLSTKSGEEHPIVKQIKDLEDLNTVEKDEKFYLKGNNTSKTSASNLKNIKISNIGFAASKTDNKMNLYVTYEGKDANDNTYIKTIKKPFKPTEKNIQLYTEIVQTLITQKDPNKQAEGYRMYANLNNDIPKLSKALYLANKEGNENKETYFPVVNHNNILYQIVKIKGDIENQKGSFYVLISKDGGKTYGVLTKTGGISTPKKLSDYKGNVNVVTQSDGQLYQDGNQALSVIGKIMYMSDHELLKNNQQTQQSVGSGGAFSGKHNPGLQALQ